MVAVASGLDGDREVAVGGGTVDKNPVLGIPDTGALEPCGGSVGIVALRFVGEGGVDRGRQSPGTFLGTVAAQYGEVVREDTETKGAVDDGEKSLVGLVAEVSVSKVGID